MIGYEEYPMYVRDTHKTEMIMDYTIAIGDIHGCLKELKALMGHIQHFTLGNTKKFIFLGDYIDRGPDSKGVIEYLMDFDKNNETREESEKDIFLMGNHEANLLSIIAGHIPKENYFFNKSMGGRATLNSYHADSSVDLIPSDHIQWMSKCQLAYYDGKRFFVHAGINREKPLDKQNSIDLLWIRDKFLNDDRKENYGGYVVHGHTPIGVEIKSNRLNLDSACVFGGVLTAAVFNNEKEGPTHLINHRGIFTHVE